MTTISQGDEYGIPIEIKINGELAAPDIFQNVEIVIGNIKKDINSGIIYSEKEKAWIFPLKQKESLMLGNGKQKAQIRAKFSTGNVQRADLGEIDIEKSISKVVL